MAIADQIFEYINLTMTIVFWGWPFFLIFLAFIAKMKWKAYPVDVVIIEKRGENLIKTNDRAGKYDDHYTGITGYKLLKSKDTIPIVNYEWVLHNNQLPTNLLEKLTNLLRPTIGTLFFFRYGSKQYKPIKVNQKGNLTLQLQEMKDKNGNPQFIKIYQQFDPRDKLGALDFEVVDWDNMNFMVQEQRATHLRRQKKGEFLKQIIIPLGAMVVAALVCILMLKFSYDWAVQMKNTQAPEPTGPATAPDIPIIGGLVPGA